MISGSQIKGKTFCLFLLSIIQSHLPHHHGSFFLMFKILSLFHLHHHFLHIYFEGMLMLLHLLSMMWATSCTRTSWFRLDGSASLEWFLHFLYCTYWFPYPRLIASLGSRSWQEVYNSLYLWMWLWHEGTGIAELLFIVFIWEILSTEIYILTKKLLFLIIKTMILQLWLYFSIVCYVTPFVLCCHFRAS